MDALLADLRYAVRTMRQNVAFSAIALAALTLGIGANTAIFTVVDTVLLQPLPYPGGDRIVRLARQFKTGVGNSVSIPKFMAWRRSESFEAMTLYDFGALPVNLGSGEPPRSSAASTCLRRSSRCSASSRCGTRVLERGGRAQRPAGCRHERGDSGQADFGGSRDVLSRSVLLNGQPYSIVGILPKSFHSEPDADIWLPIQADPNSRNQGHYLNAAGRLKAGVSLAAAQAEMKVVGDQFRKANPKWMDAAESVRSCRSATP